MNRTATPQGERGNATCNGHDAGWDIRNLDMSDDRLRSANLILAQFGAVCAGAGMLVGAVLGWWFGSSLTSMLASRGLVQSSQSGQSAATVAQQYVDMPDPLLRIFYTDRNIDPVRAHDELFPQASWSAAKVMGNRALYAQPVGAITASIMDGSCVVLIDAALRNGSFPGGFKVIYRTTSGWDHGYMKADGLADVPLTADCQARVYEVEKR